MKQTCNTVALLLAIMTFASCARQEATRPVETQKPNVPILRQIALAAIARRVPSVQHDRLEYEHTLYQLYRDHMFKQTNEMFFVEFAVRNSLREVERDGENVFEVDSISVRVQPDGGIDKGGVSSNVTRYLTADLDLMRNRGRHGSPVCGEPFHPVPLDSPLPKPDRMQIESIALHAISRFLPAVNTDDLEFDGLLYFNGHHSGSTGAITAFSITFWQTSTIQERQTKTRVILEGQQVTVRIEPDGSVRRAGVNLSPLKFMMNRQSIQEIGRRRKNRSIHGEKKTKEDESRPSKPISGPVYYKVEEGDTLFYIARMFGTSLPELKKANGLTNTAVKAGQLLKIPLEENKTAEPTGPRDGVPAAHDP